MNIHGCLVGPSASGRSPTAGRPTSMVGIRSKLPIKCRCVCGMSYLRRVGDRFQSSCCTFQSTSGFFAALLLVQSAAEQSQAWQQCKWSVKLRGQLPPPSAK